MTIAGAGLHDFLLMVVLRWVVVAEKGRSDGGSRAAGANPAVSEECLDLRDLEHHSAFGQLVAMEPTCVGHAEDRFAAQPKAGGNRLRLQELRLGFGVRFRVFYGLHGLTCTILGLSETQRPAPYFRNQLNPPSEGLAVFL